jgi:DNA-binding LacI/PurR family transcriptional regulator
LADINVPIVLLGERLLGAPYDHVVIDNVAAARAMQHLLGLGRRRIAAVDLREERGDTPRLRLRGYTETLTQAGIAIDQSLIVSTPTTRHGRMEGIESMRRLLALEHPPDAVLCFNDLVALGAMRVLQDAGYRVPDDVAVVGFDDIEEGRYAAPRLTTIAPDKVEIGRLAVSILLGRVNGSRTVPSELIQPPFQLIVRESTAGPTGAAYP